MNNNYEYDTSGVSSSLLAVGLLMPVIFCTYSKAFGGQKMGKVECSCKECEREKGETKRRSMGRSINVYRVVFLLACALIALPMKNVVYNQYGRSGGFNPYEILKVGETVSENEIEKAYRVRVREAKIRIRDKKKEKEAVQEIIRAHEILSDKKQRENWDAFGNTEKREMHVIAIPEWIRAKNVSTVMIIAYIVILGVGIPQIVSLIWRVTFERSYVGTTYKTTESLYHKMKYVKKCYSVHTLVEWVCTCSTELREHRYKTSMENVEAIKEKIETEYAIPLNTDVKRSGVHSMYSKSSKSSGSSANGMNNVNSMKDKSSGSDENTNSAWRAYVLGMSMLCIRNEEIRSLIHPDDVQKVQSEMVRCARGIRIISLALRQREIYYMTYDLERCIVQGVPEPKYWEVQYSDVKYEDVYVSVYEGNKTEQKKTERDEEICRKMFRTRITAVELYTPLDGVITDTEMISGAAEVSMRVVMTRDEVSTKYVAGTTKKKSEKEEYDVGNLDVVGVEECEQISPKELDKHRVLIRNSTVEAVHAPMYKEAQEYTWIVLVEINGVVALESVEFTPGECDTEVLLKIPALQTIVKNTKRVVMDVHLVCTNFFDRNTIVRKSLLVY